ncbi:hypothetical protein ACFHW1_05045 [Micromonospora sp. LOL_014]|uniref:hypothetical protein n=1 Tax=Micromonospora sp. LOL_014 TaxID=3345415 RepID=UPI003A8B5ED8
MARSYANIITAIWRDPEFRALTADAQRLYLLLATQPNISAVGMLPVTVGRWAAMAADTTPADIRAGLGRLVAARFIAVDDLSEELLIRSFVRHDNGYRNSKRVPVIRDAAGEIESRTLRQVLAVELVKLGLPPEWTGELPVEPDGPPDGPSHAPSDRACDGPSRPTTAAEPPRVTEPTPTVEASAFSQVDSLSDTASDRASDAVSDGISGSERVVVTRGTYVEPQPPTRNPHSATSALAPLAAAPPLALVPPPVTTQTLVAEWLDHCRKRPPENVIGHVSRLVKTMLGEGIDPADVRRGFAEWARKGLHPSTLPSVVNEVMNAGIAGAPRKPSTTDQRVADGLALAAKYDAMEASA